MLIQQQQAGTVRLFLWVFQVQAGQKYTNTQTVLDDTGWLRRRRERERERDCYDREQYVSSY
jgi:hypothetical protein